MDYFSKGQLSIGLIVRAGRGSGCCWRQGGLCALLAFARVWCGLLSASRLDVDSACSGRCASRVGRKLGLGPHLESPQRRLSMTPWCYRLRGKRSQRGFLPALWGLPGSRCRCLCAPHSARSLGFVQRQPVASGDRPPPPATTRTRADGRPGDSASGGLQQVSVADSVAGHRAIGGRLSRGGGRRLAQQGARRSSQWSAVRPEVGGRLGGWRPAVRRRGVCKGRPADDAPGASGARLGDSFGEDEGGVGARGL